MRTASLAVMTAALTTACSGPASQTPGPTAGEVPPSDYRRIVAASVKDLFFDPYSIRDAEIAPPKRGVGPSLNSDGFTTPWIVCVRAHAKNRMGAYTGRKITAFALSGGKVVNSWDEAHYSALVCQGVAFEPFTEIEQQTTSSTAKR
jgi:hypothetical protein